VDNYPLLYYFQGQDITMKTSIIHPELQKLADKFPSFTFSRRNIRFLRFMMNFMLPGKHPKDVSTENIYIPGRSDKSKIRLRMYRPRTLNGSAPAVVWLHGGGYVFGKPEQNDANCIQYVQEAGVIVFSVDYRYAPEHPFPSALEDCYDALMWVKSNAARYKVNESRIAIAGESGGGGLAAALVQMAVDRNEIKPAFQLLIYPMLDDRSAIPKDRADQTYLIWNLESNRFGWESYLGRKCGEVDVLPYSVPARREDLSALPPAWIGVGSLDLFHDEDVAYAQCLQECGVPCELEVVQGAFHGFDVAGPQLNVVRDFRRSQINALKKYLFQ
jgi:acetyl esterase/lipase